MRTKTLIIALILALSNAHSGATKLDFQTGRLLEVTMDEQLDEGTTYRRASLHCTDRWLGLQSQGKARFPME